MHKTHGLSKSPLYKLWATVKNRCYNKNDHIYPNYGGRGVRMCKEWRDDPVSFMDWCKNNGWAKGLQIDKDIKAMSLGLKPNLYSPERCQFVTPKKNGTATRKSRYIEYKGRRQTLAQWSEETGVSMSLIVMRLDYYGYTVEQVLTKKDNRYNYNKHRNVKNVFEFNGKKQSMPKWSKELGISAGTLHFRIKHYGWSIEKAFTTPLNEHKYKKC